MTNQNLPVWDLSAYYSGIDDPKIEADMAEALKKSKDFELKYRGKVIDSTAADFILTALKEFEEITLQSHKPVVFAQNVNNVDSIRPETGALLQKTMKFVMDVNSLLTFFTLELNNLSSEKLKELSEDPILKNYKHFLERLVEFKPHRLSEKEEIILQQKSLTSSHAFNRLFDDHFAIKKFPTVLHGKTVELTEPEVLDLMKDADREKRKAASISLTEGLKLDSKLLTFIYNTLGEDKSINDRFTRFETPEQSRHLDNDLDPKVVELMVNVVTENYKIVEDLYAAKKEWMGLDELYEYDRYAPIHESNLKYDYVEAKTIVLDAFKKFSDKFYDAAKLFFDNNWIHAPSMPGKRGGAYCSGGTPDKHPVILLNYQNRLDDVGTLAHELGHGVNDYMMRDLNIINYDTPLVLAETASVFAEMLVFDALKEKISDPKEKFGLYVEKIQSIFATVFRQISMYQFELAFHNARRTKGELSPDDINGIWQKTQTEMFGQSVKFSPGYETWWSYIPHFNHTPFYVYAYAFGELLVLSLYAKYKQEGESFVPKYLELMKAGVTASPQELLKPLGIDLSSREFWEGGIKIIRDMVQETKDLRKTF
ncbi:MAG TPA: M3 family oligoendopeptidase [Candidatus Binatia bacterium]|nr:M3 family oligoendopeptidase [Candidatus Binatia bacterium]